MGSFKIIQKDASKVLIKDPCSRQQKLIVEKKAMARTPQNVLLSSDMQSPSKANPYITQDVMYDHFESPPRETTGTTSPMNKSPTKLKVKTNQKIIFKKMNKNN